MKIYQNLEKLGLNEKDIEVYLALLKNGKAKPSELAKITKLNRSTLYSVAKNLLSKGIIAEDVSGNILYYSPLPPEKLENILNQAKREIKEKEKLLKSTITELNMLGASNIHSIPKIRLIEEDNLEKYLFDNTEKWERAIASSDGFWWGYQDHSFADLFEKWIEYTWQISSEKNLTFKPQFFGNKTSAEIRLKRRYPKEVRDMKYLDDTDFTANTWVCGDYLVLIVTRQHPFYLIEIHDQMIAHNTREVFKKLWNTVRE